MSPEYKAAVDYVEKYSELVHKGSVSNEVLENYHKALTYMVEHMYEQDLDQAKGSRA